jgi:signal transduction histidine kinase
MMKSLSLRTKFILAFLVASLAVIGLVGVSTSFFANRHFQSFIVDNLIDELSASVIDYYASYGTLIGISNTFRPPNGSIPPQFRSFERSGFILVHPNGRIILGDLRHPAGDSIPITEFSDVHAIEVNGVIIAYLAVFIPEFQPNPQEQEFIERTNQALFFASLFAIAIAILLGLLFTRTLLKPLSNLSAAIGRMEKGELHQKVPKISNDELGEVIDGFNQMSLALANANAQREQMTADIAHELRSPLTVINGYLEALQDGTLEASPERLEIIQQEVNQLNRLVNDLRILALADAGKLEILKDDIDIDSLFNHLKDAYNLIANAKQISLRFQKDNSLRTIYADEGRILQVLSNLLTNAIRHTEQGGEVNVLARTDKDNIIIEVSDTGEGIPEEELDQVFKRFYRSDPSRHTINGESGLGLSIVKTIVEAHGGIVSVTSQLNKGTIFTVCLPRR